MTWTLVGSDTVGFADGGSPGHTYTIPSGAPSAGDLDILTVNSNATVTTPSGWTLPTNGSKVNNQGAYTFYRKATGGEGSTVTIVTSVGTSTSLGWSRWQGASTFDLAANATVTTSAGMTTPALTTGTLASSNDLVVAFGALHNVSSAINTPVWSTGYTALGGISQFGSTAAAQWTGYKTGAGTAGESPNVSWSGGSVFNRTIIAVAFTPAGGSTVSASASLTASASLSGTAQDAIPTSVTLAAAGAVTAAAKLVIPSSAALVAVGSTTAGALVDVLCAAALSAAATMTVTLPDTSVPGQMSAATFAPRLVPATAGARLTLMTSGGAE